MCSNCDWDYEAEQTEEETPMANPGAKTFHDTPKPFNPYQSGIRIPLVTEEEIINRADLYSSQAPDYSDMDRIRKAATRKYRRSEAMHIFVSIFFGVVVSAIAIGLVIGLLTLGYQLGRYLWSL